MISFSCGIIVASIVTPVLLFKYLLKKGGVRCKNKEMYLHRKLFNVNYLQYNYCAHNGTQCIEI